jgi:two-component system chemotaxis response regulator CheY
MTDQLIETPRILIVDDSPSMRAMVSFTLQEKGYEVTQADNGSAALDRIDTGPTTYNLIIADINMPVMDGITFVREARKRKHCKYTPILMLTTETSTERIESARTAGATAWLVKPFQPERLLDATSRIMA